MKQHTNANKIWWDKATHIHEKSELYNVEGFKKGLSHLDVVEREGLSDVKGKTLLHLMCHFGMGTLSWAREGAIATGVDLSSDAIELAKKLSKEIKTPAEFICSDIYELPKVLDKKFDIIFTSYGVLCWLSDIKKWAHLIQHFMKDGGSFYMAEVHPFTNILSADFKFYYDYFDKGPYTDDTPGTYTDWKAPIDGVTYQWSYTVSDVLNALIEEGLKIEYVKEYPYTMYDQFPGFMEKTKDGLYVLKNKKFKIPLLFSIKATK